VKLLGEEVLSQGWRIDMRLKLVIPVLAIAALIIQAGCAGGNKRPVEPGTLTPASMEQQAPRTDFSQVKPWGVWTIHCEDGSNGRGPSVTAIPLRDGQNHLDVTGMLRPPICTNCLAVEVVTHQDKDWTIRATLTNPTVYTAYDVMGIFPGSGGPTILDFDSLTDMFDMDGDSTTHHPYKAFETGNPNRLWGPGETHDQVFTFRRESGQKLADVVYVVAVSRPGNMEEIVALTNPKASGPLLTDTSKPIDITVQVSDWQGDIEYVVINMAPLNGSAFAHMQPVGGGIYKLASFAAWGLTAGTTADLLIAAKSLGSPNLTYNYVSVDIIDPPPPPTKYHVVQGPYSLGGEGMPDGELDLSVIGKSDGSSSTFVNVGSTEIYGWNESYAKSDLLVSMVPPSGPDPTFPIGPVKRIAMPVPPSPNSLSTFAVLRTNTDPDMWDNTTDPPIFYRNTMQLMDLETLLVADFKLTADKPETPELDAILRPVDVSSGVSANKYGYALWVPDGGQYPTYYPFVALVRYAPPYKGAGQKYDTLIGGVPEGSGDGKVNAEDANALAVWDGDGEGNLIVAISEGGSTGEVELFSENFTSNPAGLFTPIKTIKGLPGTPLDVAILPVADAGDETENWVCILTDSKTVETYTLSGEFVESYMNPDRLPSAVRHIAVDVKNLRIHVMMDGPSATVIQYTGD
jgi:hypothetical protein